MPGRLDLDPGEDAVHELSHLDRRVPSQLRPQILEEHPAALSVDRKGLGDATREEPGQAAHHPSLVGEQGRLRRGLEEYGAVGGRNAEQAGQAPDANLLCAARRRSALCRQRHLDPLARFLEPARVGPGSANGGSWLPGLPVVALDERPVPWLGEMEPGELAEVDPLGSGRRLGARRALEHVHELEDASVPMYRAVHVAEDRDARREALLERADGETKIVLGIAVELYPGESPPVRGPIEEYSTSIYDEPVDARAPARRAHDVRVSSASRSWTVSRRRTSRASPSRTRTAAGRGTPL